MLNDDLVAVGLRYTKFVFCAIFDDIPQIGVPKFGIEKIKCGVPRMNYERLW